MTIFIGGLIAWFGYWLGWLSASTHFSRDVFRPWLDRRDVWLRRYSDPASFQSADEVHKHMDMVEQDARTYEHAWASFDNIGFFPKLPSVSYRPYKPWPVE
jgi:hypothetical protein